MKTSLKKLEWLVKGFFVNYVLGLILSKGKRVCTNIADQMGVSHDSIYRYLSKNADLMAHFPDLMIKLAEHFHAIKPGWLVIDDTAISKIHAKYIEGVHWIYNSSISRPEKGLCIVVIAWTNGDIIIPLGFSWWFSKKLYPENHQTKGKIAQRLIQQTILKTKFRKLLADAAYISIDMIIFLNERHIEFVTRIHSNRKITVLNGLCASMKNHPIFKLTRNQRAKIIKVTMQNLEVNIVCFKRKNKHTHEYDTVFLITNNGSQSAKEVIKMYNLRWEIEPMFRTMKQSFGLMQCSARSLEKQANHVNAVFFGFGFVQHEKFKKNLSCSEDAIRCLQELKINASINSFTRFCRDFYHVA
jgi:hypothetical protein